MWGKKKIVHLSRNGVLLLKELKRQMFLELQELFEETTVSMKDIYNNNKYFFFKKTTKSTQHKMNYNKEFVVCSMNSLYFQAPWTGCAEAEGLVTTMPVSHNNVDC